MRSITNVTCKALLEGAHRKVQISGPGIDQPFESMAQVHDDYMTTGFGTFKRPENAWMCDPKFKAEFVASGEVS